MIAGWLRTVPWLLVVAACLTLGLAPFSPEPHVWQKLTMLLAGELSKPIDIFDLVLHGAPWALLLVKALAGVIGPTPVDSASDASRDDG